MVTVILKVVEMTVLTVFSHLTFWDSGPEGLCFSNFKGPPKNM